MELQKLWVALGLKSAEFTKGLDEAQGRISGFSGRITSFAGSAFGTIGRAAGAAFLGVGVAAAGGFGMAMASAIDMNANLEQSTMQFTTLMGDADKAAEHVANLFEFGAKTPFETGPIIEASKTLQVFGGDALNTMDNLTLVGDAAAAVGAPIDEVSFWVGRLYSNLQSGQPFGEAAMRLQELGIMGPTVRTELEEMQKAGASADETFGAFQDQLGTFTGAMELQSGSWAGLTSTIKDNLGMAAAEGLAPFFDLAKGGLESLATWLQDPETQAAIQTFADKLTVIIDAVTNFITKLIEGKDPVGALISMLFTLGSEFGLTAEQMTPFFTKLLEVDDAIRQFIDKVSAFITEHGPLLQDILIGVGSAVAALVVINTVVGWISGLIGIVSGVIGAFTAAGSTIGGIVALLGGPLTIVIGIIAAAIGLLVVAWKNNWGDIQGKTAAAWAVIEPLLQQAWAWLKEKLTAALEALQKFWTETAWPAIQRTVEVVWPIIKRIFEGIRDFIVDTLIPKLQELYKKWTEEVWPTIQTVTENVWTIIETIFTEIGRWINDNIVPWVEYLHEKWVEEVWPAIQTAIENAWTVIEPIWQKIKEWLDETLPPVIESLKKAFEKAMSAISEAVQPVKDTWESWTGAVQRFWDWISSKTFDFKINLPDLPHWAQEGSPLNWHTAWSNFAEDMPRITEKLTSGFARIGSAIADGIVANVQSLAEMSLDPLTDWLNQVDVTAGFAGRFGNIANSLVNRYEDQVLAPLKRRLDETNRFMFSNTAQMFAQYGIDRMGLGSFQEQLRMLRQLAAASGNMRDVQFAEDRLAALEESNRLAAEYARQQQVIYDLEKARADLDFLNTQMQLLKLVSENAAILPQNILEGLEFGLGADPGSLLNAMVDVMKRLVAEANNQLQISSPSRVFARIGEQVMEGLAVGLRDNRVVQTALERSMRPLMSMPAQRAELYTPGFATGNRTVINGGYNVSITGWREPSLDELAVLAR